MSATTESRAEAIKLARLLRIDAIKPPDYLVKLPASELVAYSDAVAELLYDDELTLMRRMVDAAPLLPAQMLASVAERALGPIICARLLGLLEPQRAAEIARNLSVEFVAEVAAELDPRCAVDVVTALPDEQVLSIAVTLAASKEYVAMGRIVTHLGQGALADCIEELTDEDLLRIAFVLDDKSQLKQLVEVVGRERMQRMLADAPSLGLSEEAEDLCAHLTAAQRKQLRPSSTAARRRPATSRRRATTAHV
jgi:Mg/Co/Ni transporter MgtE